MHIELEISGMTCGGCKSAVERVLGAQQGVGKVAVDLAAGRAEVDAAEGTAPEALIAAVERAGYDARVFPS